MCLTALDTASSAQPQSHNHEIPHACTVGFMCLALLSTSIQFKHYALLQLSLIYSDAYSAIYDDFLLIRIMYAIFFFFPENRIAVPSPGIQITFPLSDI